MATFNGAKYVAEQVASILPQLGAGDELVVSDDGSTDGTVEIVQNFGDPRIRILENRHRRSAAGNFENALRNAGGDYIFLSDQDDVWLAGKVEAMLRALEGADLAIHDAIVTDGDLNPQGGSLMERTRFRRGYWHNLVRNGYSGCCMAFRRSLLEQILPFPRRIAMHDVWIGLVAELGHRRSRRAGGEAGEKVAVVPSALILLRRHGANVSTATGKSTLSIVEKAKYRVYLLSQTLKRAFFTR